MVARADVIRNTERFTLSNMLDNAFGRTILVVLKTVISGTVLLLTFLLNQTTSPHPLKYALVGAVGLIAGLSSRRLLREYSGTLRLFVSMTAVSAGLFLMNLNSLGYIGIDLSYWSHSEPDWDSLIQLGLGVFTACLVLYAWRYPKPAIDTTLGGPIQPYPLEPSVGTPRRLHPPAQKKLRLRSLSNIGGWFKRGNVSPNRTRVGSPAKRPERLGVLSLPPRDRRASNQGRIKPRRLPRIKGWHKRLDNGVNLKGAEEHRCPFCLELVILNDPRGVEICPTCQTHHHADCWEVTGICQIPHFQG